MIDGVFVVVVFGVVSSGTWMIAGGIGESLVSAKALAAVTLGRVLNAGEGETTPVGRDGEVGRGRAGERSKR